MFRKLEIGKEVADRYGIDKRGCSASSCECYTKSCSAGDYEGSGCKATLQDSCWEHCIAPKKGGYSKNG